MCDRRSGSDSAPCAARRRVIQQGGQPHAGVTTVGLSGLDLPVGDDPSQLAGWRIAYLGAADGLGGSSPTSRRYRRHSHA